MIENNSVSLRFFKVRDEAVIPSYAHKGDSGMDISSVYCYSIPPHGFAKIATGIGAVIPEGYELQVRPRSGLQAKHGIVGAFGTVDEQYRGEIGVVLYNHTNIAYVVQAEDRVAQLVLAPVIRAEISEISAVEVDQTERGANGFGSTGK